MAITLIGDLVGSRTASDRAGLHARLTDALASVNDEFDPTTPLRITVGDEYQGTFATLGAALAASLRLRLALLPEYDVRQGIGRGEVTVLSEDPRVEDGPGWWAARAAVVEVEDAERSAATRGRRTAYVPAVAEDHSADHDAFLDADPAAFAVDAALMLRDDQLGKLGERSLSVLRGLLEQRTQKEIAEEMGVTASAVSQRVRADGLATIVAADAALARTGE